MNLCLHVTNFLRHVTLLQLEAPLIAENDILLLIIEFKGPYEKIPQPFPRLAVNRVILFNSVLFFLSIKNTEYKFARRFVHSKVEYPVSSGGLKFNYSISSECPL